MSGTNSSGGTVSSGDILSGLVPVPAGGELEANGSPAIVDADTHTVRIGNDVYALSDVLQALTKNAVVTGNAASSTDIAGQKITVNNKTTTASAAIAAAQSIPVQTISASGATEIPIPASGNIAYIVTATADATLQFSGKAATGQSQIIKITVVKTAFTVSFPTVGVEVDTGAPPPTTASSVGDTTIAYRATDGLSYIEGGAS